VAVLEDEEKQLTSRLREELLRYPNLPSESVQTVAAKTTTKKCVAGVIPG
jgi:hypothetical protein